MAEDYMRSSRVYEPIYTAKNPVDSLNLLYLNDTVHITVMFAYVCYQYTRQNYPMGIAIRESV